MLLLEEYFVFEYFWIIELVDLLVKLFMFWLSLLEECFCFDYFYFVFDYLWLIDLVDLHVILFMFWLLVLEEYFCFDYFWKI